MIRKKSIFLETGPSASEFCVLRSSSLHLPPAATIFSASCRLKEETLAITPRLFECSNQTGRFLATEIPDFNQDDLEEDDVFLLDVWDQVQSRPGALPSHQLKPQGQEIVTLWTGKVWPSLGSLIRPGSSILDNKSLRKKEAGREEL